MGAPGQGNGMAQGCEHPDTRLLSLTRFIGCHSW